MTGILKRAITFDYVKILFSTLLFLIILFHLVDMIEHADNFLKNGASGWTILKFYILRTPEEAVTFLPFAILLSAVILLVVKSKYNETIAIFSAGISLFHLLTPIIAVSLLSTLFSFLISERIIPVTSSRARDIQATYLKREKRAARFLQNRYWLKVDRGIVSAQVLDAEHRKVYGFSFIELGKQGEIIRKIDAREGVFKEMVELKNVEILEIGKKKRIQRKRTLSLAIPVSFSTFFSSQKSPGDMNSLELKRYIREVSSKGYNVASLSVDYYSRFSYLILNILVVFLAAPFAITGPRKGAIVASVGIAVIIGVICWSVFSAFLAFGHKGVLPPLIAAWAPDMIVAAAAFGIYRKFRM